MMTCAGACFQTVFQTSRTVDSQLAALVCLRPPAPPAPLYYQQLPALTLVHVSQRVERDGEAAAASHDDGLAVGGAAVAHARRKCALWWVGVRMAGGASSGADACLLAMQRTLQIHGAIPPTCKSSLPAATLPAPGMHHRLPSAMHQPQAPTLAAASTHSTSYPSGSSLGRSSRML